MVIVAMQYKYSFFGGGGIFFKKKRHVSCVTCHFSCHMSRVTCHMSLKQTATATYPSHANSCIMHSKLVSKDQNPPKKTFSVQTIIETTETWKQLEVCQY